MVMNRKFVAIISATVMLFTGCGTEIADNASIVDMEAEEFFLDDINADHLTEADKKTKYINYLEAVLADNITETYSEVKSAEVTLSEKEKMIQAMISLELREEIAEDSVSEIADAVIAAMGDTLVNSIVIQDSEGMPLFENSTSDLMEDLDV